MAKKKHRLDIILKEKGLCQSRAKAQALIMAGNVLVNGKIITKAGYQVGLDDQITLKDQGCPYVSRGGLKLEAAIKYFNINVKDRICVDVGASTGGFTHCLLNFGAKKIYAIDVGFGQLDWGLRNKPEVIVMEKTNIRNVSEDMFPEKPNLAVIDTSFISLKLVMPHVLKILEIPSEIVALIKPQFEAGREKVGKGGIIRDEQVRSQVVEDIINFFKDDLGLETKGVIESPIKGMKGNVEYLTYLIRGREEH